MERLREKEGRGTKIERKDKKIREKKHKLGKKNEEKGEKLVIITRIQGEIGIISCPMFLSHHIILEF